MSEIRFGTIFNRGSYPGNKNKNEVKAVIRALLMYVKHEPGCLAGLPKSECTCGLYSLEQRARHALESKR